MTKRKTNYGMEPEAWNEDENPILNYNYPIHTRAQMSKLTFHEQNLAKTVKDYFQKVRFKV